jgi:hypothetical protein
VEVVDGGLDHGRCLKMVGVKDRIIGAWSYAMVASPSMVECCSVNLRVNSSG